MLSSTHLLALSVSLLTGILPVASAQQQFISPPTGLTSILSKNYPGASISYKENSICETTQGVRSWNGYVNLPSSLTPDASYDTSLFFWYFESRNNSQHAPTTIYLPGGPGTSFLDGASGFPCIVNPDSNSTTLNPWSFNGAVNMLYVDAPVQTGYSYTKAKNGTVDLFTSQFTPITDASDEVTTNLTTVAATMSSQDPADTLNTTQQVARVMWQFAQVWLQEFPEYRTDNKEINMWGYSYSGFFAPATLAYFQRQSERIRNGSSTDPKAKPVQLGTIGLNNGCIDTLSQAAAYPEYAYNNTYGVQIYSQDIYEEAKRNLTEPGGCLDAIKMCRAAAALSDPEGHGTNQTVNLLCLQATNLCFVQIQGAYHDHSDRSPFDLSLRGNASFPPDYAVAYYNQRWVQEALGVPVNYSYTTMVTVNNFFGATGDPMRYDGKADLEYLATRGVNIAFVYGDRDYRCNWLGVENVSLTLSYPGAADFRKAGYAQITTNASYAGGLVRQHGNVSFSRVFEAGHSVAAYQPETVYRIFERATYGRDVATGQTTIGINGQYSTSGPESSLATKNELPDGPPSVCYLYVLGTTCTPDELAALRNGTAVVEDYIVRLPGAANGGGNGSGSGSGDGNGNGNGNGTGAHQNAVERLRGSMLGAGLVPLALGLAMLSL